jgi:hypothetical protein
LLAAFVALFGVIYESNKNVEIAKLPIEATQAAEAKLTALVPTSTTPPLPTLTPTLVPPFDVFVTIDGNRKKVEPNLPVKFPPLTEITIEVQLANNAIDRCNWNFEWQEAVPTPEPQGCTVVFIPLTSEDTIVYVNIFTSGGESMQRKLIFTSR